MKATYYKCLTSYYIIIMLTHSCNLFFICIADVFVTSSLFYKHCVIFLGTCQTKMITFLIIVYG